MLSETYPQPILQIFSKKGDLIRSYEQVESFDVDGKGNCIYSTNGTKEFLYSGFFKIDSRSGKEIYRNTSKTPDLIRYNSAGSLIYGININGGGNIDIFEGETGEFIKSVFTFGKDTTYTADSYSIEDFLVDENDSLYFSLKSILSADMKFSDLKLKTFAYKREMGEITEKPVALTITAPYRNDFIAEAIIKYEKKYPEEKIQYDYVYNSRKDYLENVEEYNKKLTLDILSGEVGDIVLTGGSGIAYKDLARTDAFMDLTPYIEKNEVIPG